MSQPLYQQIKKKYQLNPACHITHIDNLDGIIQDGLQSHNKMKGKKYFDLSDSNIQLGRQAKTVDVTGVGLHDYVPIYFGWKPPMIMRHQDKNEEIIYLRFSLEILEIKGVVFTDGNARSNDTKFYLFSGIDNLRNINSKIINAVKWGNDEEKRQKQAEILIPDSIDFSQVFDIICFSENAKERVLDILEKYGINKTVKPNPGFYFDPKKGKK